jgi:hypothetical protein
VPDIGRLVQINAHPAAFREDVVRLGPARCDERVPDLFRKRDVDEPVLCTCPISRRPKRYSVPPKRCGCAVIPAQACKAL